jgi:hypothetical protein
MSFEASCATVHVFDGHLRLHGVSCSHCFRILTEFNHGTGRGGTAARCAFILELLSNVWSRMKDVSFEAS